MNSGKKGGGGGGGGARMGSTVNKFVMIIDDNGQCRMVLPRW